MNRGADRRDRLIDGELIVHAWTRDGFLRAGLLSLEEDGENISASFQYDAAYLSHPESYPLDPINLPLGSTRFATASQFVTLGAIFDAAPDAWGRRVVQAQLAQEARGRVFRGAFLRGADGIGALVMTPLALDGEIKLEEIIQQSLDERPALSQLQRAASAALLFEQGEELTQEIKEMLGGSWTIGGARPKAILRQDDPQAVRGESVIAKFGSRHDTVDRLAIEYASLQMAAAMGMNPCGHRLVEVGGGKEAYRALILDRFDRRTVDGLVHRRHYLSAMSLVSHQPQSKFLNSMMDQAMISWGKLIDVAARVAARPGAAKVEMFARLCLNTALHNTDDHLKNFGFLRMEQGHTHYEVAPVFDVSPQAADRHYLHCADLGQVYNLKEVISRARALGIAKGAAEEVEQRILEVLDRRDEFFDEADLNREQGEMVGQWIEMGLGPVYTSRPKAQRPAAQIDPPPRERIGG